MPKEYDELPPVRPEIFREIAALLPEGHLKTYWEGLVGLQKLPKDDPILVAVLAMGIFTIVFREGQEASAKMVASFRSLTSDEEATKKLDFRLSEVKEVCRDAVMAIRNLMTALSSAERATRAFNARLDQSVENKVEKMFAARSYFDTHPLAVAYVAIVSMILGMMIGYIFGHHS